MRFRIELVLCSPHGRCGAEIVTANVEPSCINDDHMIHNLRRWSFKGWRLYCSPKNNARIYVEVGVSHLHLDGGGGLLGCDCWQQPRLEQQHHAAQFQPASPGVHDYPRRRSCASIATIRFG